MSTHPHHTGKCPKCDQKMAHIVEQSVMIWQGDVRSEGRSYQCPHCHTVLSAGLEPVAELKGLVGEIKKYLSFLQ
ncbi:MAG: hypothetical protein ABI443_02290 [Chthoniobacterales bacterium]